MEGPWGKCLRIIVIVIIALIALPVYHHHNLFVRGVGVSRLNL